DGAGQPFAAPMAFPITRLTIEGLHASATSVTIIVTAVTTIIVTAVAIIIIVTVTSITVTTVTTIIIITSCKVSTASAVYPDSALVIAPGPSLDSWRVAPLSH